MLRLGVTSKIGNPKVISISSLLALLPPSFEALSSSPMFSKRDEDGDSVTELAVFSFVVVGTASGSNYNTPILSHLQEIRECLLVPPTDYLR